MLSTPVDRITFETWLAKLSNWSQQTDVQYINQASEVYQNIPDHLFRELRHDKDIKAGKLFDGTLVDGSVTGLQGKVPRGLVLLVSAMNARGMWLQKQVKEQQQQLEGLTSKRKPDEDVSAFTSRFNSMFLSSSYDTMLWGQILVTNLRLDANKQAMVMNQASPLTVANVVRAVYLLFGQPKTTTEAAAAAESVFHAFRARRGDCATQVQSVFGRKRGG